MTTIMVVEPDVLARMVISDYLRTCGYTIVECVSSDEAMAVLGSATQVDVVFAEVAGLGSRDGFELAQLIHASHPQIDVLLTSGVNSAASKAGELCDHGVVPKPYHHEDVAQRIASLRERRRRNLPE